MGSHDKGTHLRRNTGSTGFPATPHGFFVRGSESVAEAGQACSQDGWEAGPAMFLNGLRRTPVQAVPGRSGLLRRYNSWFRPGNIFERTPEHIQRGPAIGFLGCTKIAGNWGVQCNIPIFHMVESYSGATASLPHAGSANEHAADIRPALIAGTPRFTPPGYLWSDGSGPFAS